MLQVFRPTPDMSSWIDVPSSCAWDRRPAVSRLPAVLHAMLTMRLMRASDQSAAVASLSPPMFHTLSTEPTAYAHTCYITALGLLVRPAAAACLEGHACGAVANQVLPWEAIAGSTEVARLEEKMNRRHTDLQRLHALTVSFRRTMDAVSQGATGSMRICATS